MRKEQLRALIFSYKKATWFFRSHNLRIILLDEFLIEKCCTFLLSECIRFSSFSDWLKDEKQIDSTALFDQSYFASGANSVTLFKQFSESTAAQHNPLQNLPDEISPEILSAMHETDITKISSTYLDEKSLDKFSNDLLKTTYQSYNTFYPPPCEFDKRRCYTDRYYQFYTINLNRYSPFVAALIFNKNDDIVLFFAKQFPDEIEKAKTCIQELIGHINRYTYFELPGRKFYKADILDLKSCQYRFEQILINKIKKITTVDELETLFDGYFPIATHKKSYRFFSNAWFENSILKKAKELGGEDLALCYQYKIKPVELTQFWPTCSIAYMPPDHDKMGGTLF